MKKRPFGTKHLITTGSIIMAFTLLVNGVVNPDGFIMSFAAVSDLHTVLRSLVLLGLGTILVSRPPRPMAIRVAIGAMSSMILVGSFVTMADYQIGVLDAVLYLLVSIILTMEAIEEKTAPVRFSQLQSAE